MTEVIVDLIKVIKTFCKEHRHGIIEIHVKNHRIQGVKKNAMEYMKLPLKKSAD